MGKVIFSLSEAEKYRYVKKYSILVLSLFEWCGAGNLLFGSAASQDR